MQRISIYVKMQVLGAIDFAEGATIRDRIRSVSQKTFHDEKGRPCQFTWRTIETWRARYNKHGLTGVTALSRRDKGKIRKVSRESLLEAINTVLPQLHGKSYNRALVYRLCIEQGLLRREDVAPNTFSRLVKTHELLKPESEVTDKARLAFAKDFANQMWQADTLFGPTLPGTSAPTKLIAFIDDASRVVPHGEFFATENTDHLISALRSAIYKRGLPEQLYFDNGSPYCAKEITLVCARLGILLCHTPVRDAAAKGKIERFFRTVREDFLRRQLDLSSLEILNRQFLRWLEENYNAKTHSILKMPPIDRFGLNLGRIKFLPPHEISDEIFYLETQRVVRADNTFQFDAVRFEGPADLRNKTITIRYPRTGKRPVIVYFNDQRIGLARVLNAVANDRMPPGSSYPRATL